jgi:uncharacterized peroxidase-related enzyme
MLKPVKLNEAMQAYFDKCREKIGFVPNVLTAYSHNMEKLQNFIALYDELMLGASSLSKLEREMIAVVVSSENKCYYCLTAHGAAVRKLSKDPILGEQLVMNYRVANLSEKQRAMLDFAVMLTQSPEMVEEEDRQSLRDAGFSDAAIWDIAATIAFFNMSNRMASAVDMQPNNEYHRLGR